MRNTPGSRRFLAAKIRRTAALAGWVLALSAPAFAQVEANRASAEELMRLPGIGAVRAERIVQARAQRPFADWADLQARVAGIGPRTAETLSQHGLRVDGRSYGSDLARGRAGATARPGSIAKKNERSYD
ncbi:comE: comEA protein [Tepidimonas thermarum]|uniref:ComE: comEA protein n=1 Tax=Tepidimonas thermarum TaxID=335431 RepID=A0A554WY94_9BURK|nr:helix-hairpin-helix domain-containing protein [Tepidimonas thermarum]TSE28550.1 comE: comEA protein [Tepidimonas thermarum]